MRSIVTDKALNIVIKPPMSAPLSFAKKGSGYPPAHTRSTSSARSTPSRSGNADLLSAMSSSQLTKSSGLERPSISPIEKGFNDTDVRRPAKESPTPGSFRRLADPVNRKRPGRRSRSTVALRGRIRSGSLYASSTTNILSGACSKKDIGSNLAKSKVGPSSKVT